MNVGIDNKLTRTELVNVREEKWFTPVHQEEGFPVFTYAGIRLCYAAYTSAELCQKAIEQDFPQCIVREVADNSKFLAYCRRVGGELLIDLDTEKKTFGIISDGPVISPGSDAKN